MTVVLLLASALTAGRAGAQTEAVRPSFAEVKPGRDAEDTYQKNAVGVVHYRLTSVSPFSFVFGGQWWRAYRGRYRLSVTYREFFESLGRPDLADQHDRRRLVGGILIWGGLAAEIAGAYLFFTGFGESGVRWKVGAGVFGAGLVASAIGAGVEKPVVSEDEAGALADRYNQLLSAHLGARAGAGPRLSVPSRRELSFAPVVMPGSYLLVSRLSW